MHTYLGTYVHACIVSIVSEASAVRKGQYPMYVVPFEYFMNMRSVKSHQELLSSKILVEFAPELLGELLKVLKNTKTKGFFPPKFLIVLSLCKASFRLIET